MKPSFSRLAACVAAASTFCAVTAQAAPNSGDLDQRWGLAQSGKMIVPFDKGQGQNPLNTDTAAATVVGTKGKNRGVMYIAGTVYDETNRPRIGVAALDRAGELSADFSTDGRNVTQQQDLIATAVALSPDETRVYVAGYTIAPNSKMIVCQFSTISGASVNFSNDNECVEPMVPGMTQTFATDVVVQPDGKIVLAGYAGTQFTQRNAAFARFDANGAPDLGFGGDAEFNTGLIRDNSKFAGHEINAITLMPDGRFVAVGYTRANNSLDDEGLVLVLAANGTLDPGPQAESAYEEDGAPARDTYFEDAVAVPAIGDEPAGVVVIGKAERFANTYSGVMMKIDTDGSNDTGFGTTLGRTYLGAPEIDFAFTDVAVQDGGALIALVRRESDQDAGTQVMRYDSSGIQDLGFGFGGETVIDFGTAGGYNDPAGLDVLGNSGVYVAVDASQGGTNTDFFAAKLGLEAFFEDSFEGE